jgi:hypothetical protein
LLVVARLLQYLHLVSYHGRWNRKEIQSTTEIKEINNFVDKPRGSRLKDREEDVDM